MGRAACKNELYQHRRSTGLCVQCGADAGGKSRCTLCAEKDKTARQRRRASRKAAGVCTACGRAAKDGCVLCQTCIDQRSKVSTDRYYRNKAADVCRLCGSETDGNALCEKCRMAQKKHAHNHYQRRVDVGRCPRCGGPGRPDRVLCLACAKQRSAVDARRYVRYRTEVFNAYGGPKCVHCGTTDLDVLQIDHVNGGGTQHRKEVGYNIYAWLHMQGFPPGYQVLCANCNTKKGRKVTTCREVGVPA